MALRIMDRRARLLGLYPEQGKTTALLVEPVGGDVAPIQVEFFMPSRREPEPPPADAPPAPPVAWQRALPA
jgi:hypothetical protein